METKLSVLSPHAAADDIAKRFQDINFQRQFPAFFDTENFNLGKIETSMICSVIAISENVASISGAATWPRNQAHTQTQR
jgi:hypothetical protein